MSNAFHDEKASLSTAQKTEQQTRLLPSHAELVRAYRMDELWISRIAEHLDRLALATCGLERYSAWRSGLSALGQAVSKMLYYGATTSRALQTLGEEYVNVVQVDRSRRRLPGNRARLLLLLLQCLFPDLLLWLLRRAERRCRADPTLSEPVRHRRLALLSNLSALATVAYELNSALFYINGSYYQLSKRLLGINYLRTRPGLGHVTEALYRLIGWLSFARMATRAVVKLRSVTAAISAIASEPDTSEKSTALLDGETLPAASGRDDNLGRLNRTCPLCCDQVQEASVIALCGHVFCWACIVRCLQLTGRCPLCRLECQPNRVVHLAGYSDAPF